MTSKHDSQSIDSLKHIIALNLSEVFRRTETTSSSFARCIDIPAATLNGYVTETRLPPVSLLVKIKAFYEPAFGKFDIDKFLTYDFYN